MGIATGIVDEIYHDGYAAKRMEIGALIGAAPVANVRRERPAPGDVVILLGGRTGRDGCGGATGSSKSHTLASLTSCGAEVQKGNRPRSASFSGFQSHRAARMIKDATISAQVAYLLPSATGRRATSTLTSA